jgi:DNA polymerase-1
MRIIRTHESKSSDLTSQSERDWVYNGLDCCITMEVLDALLPQLDETTERTYNFSLSLQGPVLEMGLRGILVDQKRKNEVLDLYFDQLEQLEANLERIVLDGVGLPGFNWRSTADLRSLFYDYLRIPTFTKNGRPTVDRIALEKMEAYIIARPIVRHMKAMRDLGKKISFLKTGIDPDGRMRTSYNIAGTSTGRFSSSYSEFGTGTNLQNVEEALRSIFIADPGMKMAKFDAKSGESFCVGAIEWNLFRDSRYLEACESGDPHTAAARICWPELSWTNNLSQDKDLAETPYYRHYTYRFMCKKLGHGSNYGGRPGTLSTQAKVPIGIVQDFQSKYFRAFPAHQEWHEWVDETIRRTGTLTSLTDRRRRFFGRRTDDSTLREAIAFDPQGSLADIVNTAMYRIWKARTAELLMQDHDAITIQYPEEQEDEIIPQILEQLKVTIPLQHNRTLEIPYDAKVGWNRGDYSNKNPHGLKDWKGGDKRQRPKEVGILDRELH